LDFAVNYSPQAAALLQSGALAFDLFKCPDWPNLVAEAAALRPVYVHFPLNVGDGSTVATDWARIDQFLTTTPTRYVNLHIVPHLRDFADAASEAELEERVFAAVMTDLDRALRRYGSARVIVENAPFRFDRSVEDFVPCAVQPSFFQRVVEAAGCGLLLDVSHARLTAWTLGVDALAYLDAMPLHALRELHFTGIQPVDGALADHTGFTAADWTATEAVVARLHSGAWPLPELVALEYGGVGPHFEWRSEASVLAADVPRLRALLQGDPG
jgi:uncharacterized protein (UPF0276 family)